MKKTLWPLAVVLLLTASGGTLRAGDFKHTAGGVSIWLPDGWEIDRDETENALYADAPDGDAFCVLEVLAGANDLGTALNAYNDALYEEMDDFTVTVKERQGKLNGWDTLRISGEGLRDEKAWSVDVLLIATAKGALMCAFGWEKEKAGQFTPLRDKVFPSIKKID
jgi:predicted Zn-dependent protease